MKQLVYILTACVLMLNAQAQYGRPDTSYSIKTEYQKLIKDYPGITIPERSQHPDVKEERNVPYAKGLLMDVFSPAKKKSSNGIGIILIHGGGWRSGDKSLHHTLAQRLAEIGYTCFTIQYRLSTSALYPAAVYDIKAAVMYIRNKSNRYKIDSKKIVVAGHSAGGELAAFIGSTNNKPEFDGPSSFGSSVVNAVIDMDGILAFIHPESGEGDDSKKLSAATQWFGKSKTADPELWKQASPLTHVGKNNPPVLFINSSVARMHAGREDFIKVLDQHQLYSRVETFDNAPHSFILFNPWFEQTVGMINDFLTTVFSKKPVYTFTVAKDGTGNFTTVQEAINAAPDMNKKPCVIFIKKGIYKEKVLVDSLKSHITLIGENKFNTILTYDDHTGKISPAGDTINTRTSWSIKIKAGHFTAMNITFRNDAGFSAGQAVAVESSGDKAIFKNCRFIGNQDVLFTNNDKSRQYYENCYIEGTTDFIFGSSTLWFQHCRIYSKKNSHITAASTPKENTYGYVFNYCELSGDTSLHNVSLGRPWRPFASVIYLHCYIGAHIKPEGWSNWNNTDNYKTTRYAEYANFGPSADLSQRVSWARQLTKEEAELLTIEKVLGNWKIK